MDIALFILLFVLPVILIGILIVNMIMYSHSMSNAEKEAKEYVSNFFKMGVIKDDEDEQMKDYLADNTKANAIVKSNNIK